MDFYREEVEDIYSNLKTSEKGLSQIQAKARLEKNGLNELKTEVKISRIKIFVNQFKSFIIYILIFAVLLSITLNHYTDAILILIILLANAIIGYFQEYGAQKSLEALKKLNTVNCKVYRNENLIEVDSKELVKGDIVFLEAGDKIPADCRIIECSALKVEESALTGESTLVQKHSDLIEDKKTIGDRKNMLFSSTSIANGSAKAIVVKTAMETEIGKITELISEAKEEETPLQRRLDAFGKKLGMIIIGICIFVFGLLLFTKGVSMGNLVIFGLIAVSLAVAAVPTALPAVVTIALSIGVKRLLKKKALVRKLSSVETLGSCDVICTDKTGTLTQNQMTVKEVWDLENTAKISGGGYNVNGVVDGDFNDLLFKIGLSCNNSSHYKKDNLWTISGDPTEAALLVSAKKAKIDFDFKRLKELPFDSTRKLMSVLVKVGEKQEVHTKGAPNELLKRCTHTILGKKKVELTDELRERITVQINEYSDRALRVLAFAYKQFKDEKNFTEENLTFVGLQAMIDPPRPDVIESIKKTKDAGIRVIMITGDYVKTAKAIGKEIGIVGEALSGSDVDKMSDNDLKKALNQGTNIFARVIPEHKQRIVTLLQEMDHIVAMTGDGVNDAPALKKANIGVAVGSGTDVAKEASDFVLLDDSFSNIVNAIEEGRGIYDNIQKSIMLLLSGNVGEVLVIFFAVLFGLNLPLTAILLLWINLVTDGAPALAFSVDPYNKNIMKKKPNSNQKTILPKAHLFLIGFLGFIGSLIGLFMFSGYNMGSVEGSAEHILAQTMMFNFVVLYEILLVFIIRRQFKVKQLTNKWLYGAIVLSVVLQAILMYTPLSEVFKITGLALYDYFILLAGGFLFFGIYFIYSKFIDENNEFFAHEEDKS